MLIVYVSGAMLGLAILYALICVVVAHRFTTAGRCRPALPQMDQHRVTFAARDGRARVAAWYLPTAQPRGAVVFVHGKDACRGQEVRASTLDFAQAMCASGLSVLMIDLRGHGDSSAARLTYGVRERFDVLGAVDYLVDRGYLPGCIGVFGASMGGCSSLMAAQDEPAIAALVIDSPYCDFGQMIQRQFRRLSGLPSFFLPGSLRIAVWLTGLDLSQVRPLDSAGAMSARPVLVIHATGDLLIPCADGELIARRCGGEYWPIDAHGHLGAYRSMPPEYQRRVIDFFTMHLGRLADPRTPRLAVVQGPAR